MRLNKDNSDRIERDISPSMMKVITIPVENEKGYAVCIYITSSPFSSPVPNDFLCEVAGRLKLSVDR